VQLNRLELQNFRNLSDLDIEFHPRGNLFLGSNGSGKTNLLEGIYTLAMVKSFRGREGDLIQFGEEFFRIKGIGSGLDGDLKAEFYVTKLLPKEKKILRNGHAVSPKEWVGTLPVVPLSLEDGEIVRGGPEKRRQFLNILLSIFSKPYLQDLLEYRRVLRQRNRILYEGKEIRSTDRMSATLDGWDEQLVVLGSRIMTRREEVIQVLSEDSSLLNNTLSDNKCSLSLSYKPSIPIDTNNKSPIPPLIKGARRGLNIEEHFWETLERYRRKEKEWGKTLAGPHLDDLEINLDNLSLRKFGSEGEQRTAAIALKLGMAKFLEREKKEPPILLLDEVSAELDQERTFKLLSLLFSEFNVQIFIATAKEEFLVEKTMGNIQENSSIPLNDFTKFRINKGEIRKIK
jgi:DNA replication and repair protein RecF